MTGSPTEEFRLKNEEILSQLQDVLNKKLKAIPREDIEFRQEKHCLLVVSTRPSPPLPYDNHEITVNDSGCGITVRYFKESKKPERQVEDRESSYSWRQKWTLPEGAVRFVLSHFIDISAPAPAEAPEANKA